MSTAASTSPKGNGSSSVWQSVVGLVLRTKPDSLPIANEASQIAPLEVDGERVFFVSGLFGGDSIPAVKQDDEVQIGQALAKVGERELLPCPLTGTVAGIRGAPNLRGGKPGLAIHLAPASAEASAAWPPLDPQQADAAELLERIRVAGVLSNEPQPRPLTEQLEAAGNVLVVQVLDREPQLSGSLSLFRERQADAVRAARVVAKAAGASRALLAVSSDMSPGLRETCRVEGVELLSLAPRYPDSLPTLVRAKLGGKRVPVLSVESALAALDAVLHGRPQQGKVISVIGPGGRERGNFRVPLGAPLRSVLEALDIVPAELDRVIAGGPMRGFAQFSLETAIDAGVDALIVQRADEGPSWSDEPCINCGRCIDACPVDLQVQLIGRYSEFSLFERCAELEIERCIECGMCATSCTARRPLLQLIRLAKHELAAAAADGETND